MARSLIHIILLSVLFFHTTYAVACYSINGLAYTDNVICPGSEACCGVNATCLSNRLYRNEGQDDTLDV